MRKPLDRKTCRGAFSTVHGAHRIEALTHSMEDHFETGRKKGNVIITLEHDD